jgi:hypothetical protein
MLLPDWGILRDYSKEKMVKRANEKRKWFFDIK